MTPAGIGHQRGPDAGLVRDLAVHCEGLGYHSLWSNDEPAAAGLETLTQCAAAAPRLPGRRGRSSSRPTSAAAIAAEIARLGAGSGQALGRDRVWPTTRVARHRAPAVAELRGSSAGTRIVLAAMRPRLCRLGGAIADGVLLNWMLPAQAVMARRWVIEGADEEGRSPPLVASYLHRPGPTPAAAAPRRGEPLPQHQRGAPQALRGPWIPRSAASVWPHQHDHKCSRDWHPTCCARPSHRSAACRTGRSLAPSRGDRSRAVMATQPCDANA